MTEPEIETIEDADIDVSFVVFVHRRAVSVLVSRLL